MYETSAAGRVATQEPDTSAECPADRMDAQYAALEVTSVGIDDEEDLTVVLLRLRAARSAVARRRKGLTE
jgi:hypothetical protein